MELTGSVSMWMRMDVFMLPVDAAVFFMEFMSCLKSMVVAVGTRVGMK